MSAENTESRTDPTPKKKERRFAASEIAILLATLLGMFIGIGSFTFGYGKGASYLSNDPTSCANCHIMQDHFDTWQKSSHHHVASCNDCHLPHNFVGKWVSKADNGLFHSLAFTLQNYHDPIQIKPRNKQITQNACVSCHEDFVHAMLPVEREAGIGPTADSDMLSCVHCHADVGHAFRTLSSGAKRERKNNN